MGGLRGIPESCHPSGGQKRWIVPYNTCTSIHFMKSDFFGRYEWPRVQNKIVNFREDGSLLWEDGSLLHLKARLRQRHRVLWLQRQCASARDPNGAQRDISVWFVPRIRCFQSWHWLVCDGHRDILVVSHATRSMEMATSYYYDELVSFESHI